MPDAEVVSRDPYTGETVLRAPAATPADTRAAAARAHTAAGGWSATPVSERAAALRRFAQAIDRDADELVDLIVREVGKRVVDAAGEVEWTALSARWYADNPPAEERAGSARVVRRPLGVVAAVTPWNVPLVTPAWKWLPALMAGNAVVWKPSERATAIALAARDRLVDAGIPEDVLQVLPGGAQTAAELCADDRVDAIHFTGSEAGGRALAALGAERFARCALEMSGLNPAIVLADADLDQAARLIAESATALAGQKCTAIRRVLVDAGVRKPLEALLVGQLESLTLGDPRDPATDVGPLISPGARSATEDRVATAVANGARILARGAAPDDHDGFLAPTLVGDLAPDESLRRHELFAPVVAIESFGSNEDAWRLANAASYGLSAAVYGRDEHQLREAAARVRAGVLAVNRRSDAVDLEAPFGGHKRSGNGRAEGGAYVYDSVSELQALYGLDDSASQ